MPWCLRRRLARLSGAALLVGLMAIGLSASAAWAQSRPRPMRPRPARGTRARAGTRPIPLGRDTPRGTVLGFLNAGKDAKSEIAVQYLRTELKGADAAALSHQLFTVLDARLPAKLAKLSDAPEGSRANPLKINEEVVGTVERAGGSLDIIVERVEQPTGPRRLAVLGLDAQVHSRRVPTRSAAAGATRASASCSTARGCGGPATSSGWRSCCACRCSISSRPCSTSC